MVIAMFQTLLLHKKLPPNLMPYNNHFIIVLDSASWKFDQSKVGSTVSAELLKCLEPQLGCLKGWG